MIVHICFPTLPQPLDGPARHQILDPWRARCQSLGPLDSFGLASQSESSRVTFFLSLEGPELASAAEYNMPGLRDEELRTTPVHLAHFALHGHWSQGAGFLLSVTWQSPGGRQRLDS